MEEFIDKIKDLELKLYEIEKISKGFNVVNGQKKYLTLGQGGFGTVRVGRICWEKIVAVKSFYDEHDSEKYYAKFLDRVFKEIKMQNLASMSSEFVPKVLGVTRWRHGTKIAMLTEKYSGATLSDLVTYDWAPFAANAELHLRMACQISTAVFHLHKVGILHNDVTTRNVLLDDDVNCKLIDFGCATLENENSSKSSGTPGFSAPEDDLSCLSDVYSFGVVLKHVLYSQNCDASQSDGEIGSLLNSYACIESDAAKTIFKKLAGIANEATKKEACERPSIEKVVNELEGMMLQVDKDELEKQVNRLKSCDIFKQPKIEDQADGWTSMSDDRSFVTESSSSDSFEVISIDKNTENSFSSYEIPAEILKTSLVVLGGFKPETYTNVSKLDLTNQKWSNLPDLPEGRWSGMAVSHGDLICSIGGKNTSEVFVSRLDFLETRSSEELCWKRGPDMIQERGYSSAAIDTRTSTIFVAGGDACDILSEAEMYKIGSPQWTSCGSLCTPRYGHAMEYCEGRIYCMGGWGGVRRLKCVETYDCREGVWRRDVEEMGQTRNLFASCVLDDCIYAVGGFDGYPVTTCEKLDVRMNKWLKIADLQLSRYGMDAVVIDDKIYAVGGSAAVGGKVIRNNVECYDHKADKWTSFCSTNLPYWRSNVVAI